MKAILITAPASGSGKTTVTLGLVRALKQKGHSVCAYKAGPDYIDRAFLEQASGLPAGNLDLHLQGTDGLFYSLSKAPADMCVIEGAMGYFDGISNTCRNSSYDIARLLKIPSLLVYTPKGEMFSAVPKIKGMAEFEDSTINSVLFNAVSEKHYLMLREAVEQHTDLSVVGYIPKLEDAVFESRHLGLVQSNEIGDLELKIDTIAAALCRTVDLERLVTLMKQPATRPLTADFTPDNSGVRVAVARDKAFSFYYRENLELLETISEVTYFSPLVDRCLPDCDLIYFGGGYPEVFREELSANTAMLNAVKRYGESNGYIFAECGGLMYLTEQIEDSRMVGLLKGQCTLTRSLQRFGYIDLTLSRPCFLGKAGTKFTGHEFHKSTTSVSLPTVFAIKKTGGDALWNCGFSYKNVIAGYPHIHFLGNIKLVTHMLQTIGNSKRPHVSL